MVDERNINSNNINRRLCTGGSNNVSLTPNFCPFCGEAKYIEKDTEVSPYIINYDAFEDDGDELQEFPNAVRYNCYSCRISFYLEE